MQENTDETVTRNVNESADKITLTTKVKRGSATRDQDEVKVKIKGDEPMETVVKLQDTLHELESRGVAQTLRETQPEVSDDE